LWQHYAKLKRQRRIDRRDGLRPRRAMPRIPSLLAIRKPADIGFVMPQTIRSGQSRVRAVARVRTSFERRGEWH
jgi:hypothetical protein